MATEKIIFDIFPLLPATTSELCEQLGKPRYVINKILKRSKQQNRMHIGRWQRPSNGPFAAVWYKGPGVDAVCLLEHYGRSEINKRYRRRKQHPKPNPFSQLFNI